MASTSEQIDLVGDTTAGSLLRGGVWIGLQIIPLTICLSHVPLWARPAVQWEVCAPVIVGAAQWIGSALLFAWLLDRRGSAAFVIGSAWTFTLLAAIAAEQPLRTATTSALWLTGWLALLQIGAHATRGAITQAALATFFVSIACLKVFSHLTT